MSVGTPGFAPARLREAREARGLTAVSLAECVGVTPQAVSRYEHAETTTSPSPAVLSAIAGVLNFPETFFTMPVRASAPRTVFYRSMSSATKRARTSSQWKLEWLRDMGAYLEGFVSFPEPNLPDLRLPADPLLISDDDIENAAEDARRFWMMGEAPIGNVITLLENQGIVVARHELGAESLDSLSVFDGEDGRPYIILGTDKGTAVRWRFDAAHELGHLLLHRHVDGRDLARPEGFKRIEEQAHRFAAAFLLPLSPFADEAFAADLDVFRMMKPKWKVSIALMIIRARHAGLVKEESEKRLWINLSRRGWRREEPYDADMPAEEPRLLRRAVELILANGAQTADDMAARLQLGTSDIEGLVGFPPGYLAGDFVPVHMLRSRASGAPRPDLPPAEVIPLPFRRRED